MLGLKRVKLRMNVATCGSISTPSRATGKFRNKNKRTISLVSSTTQVHQIRSKLETQSNRVLFAFLRRKPRRVATGTSPRSAAAPSLCRSQRDWQNCRCPASPRPATGDWPRHWTPNSRFLMAGRDTMGYCADTQGAANQHTNPKKPTPCQTNPQLG